MPAAPKQQPDTEAFVATFKAGGGYSDPWLVIRADSASQLQNRIDTALQNSLFAVVGNAAKDFAATYRLGSQLDARPVEAPVAESTPAAPEPAAEAPQEEAPAPANDAAGQPWGAAQTGASWPDPPEDPAQPATRPEPAAMTPPKSDEGGWPPAPAWAQ